MNILNASQVTNDLHVMQKMRVRSLGREDPLEKERLPTPVFCLENSLDCIVHGVVKSTGTQLSDFHFHFLSNVCLCFIF